MNKTSLKKIAYELNIELKENSKAFIYAICYKCLKANGLSNRDLWLRNFIDFNDEIQDNVWKILDSCDEREFENPEVIGWLYQYFISDEKNRVFNNLKNNVKIEKNDIPYATQLFTPDWIVKFLVENSLGRFTNFEENLEYYVPVQNGDIKDNKKIDEITFIDPCCGTGNILIYCFDLFFKAYLSNGFSKEEAIKNILTKNLYGIDIDELVCKITEIVLILKTSNVYKNIFDEDYINNMNIIAIKNSNNCDKKYPEISNLFKDADEYGSLLKASSNIKIENNDKNLRDILKQYKILSQKYDIVCTNPPYMGKKNINNKLSEFLKKEYPDTKSEMYAAFIERCLEFAKENGYLAMITIHSWMFISSFKNLRNKLLSLGTFINMLHTGPSTFSDLSSFNALATSFVFKKSELNIDTCFIRLSDYYNFQEKIDNFKNNKNYYYLNQNRFYEIPNQPFIYWISEKVRNCFKYNKSLNDFYEAKQGLATGNNKEFVKFWYEVPFSEIGQNCKNVNEFFETGKLYAPFNKGGIFRKWYGNFEYVIKFDKENYSKLMNQGNHLPSRRYYFDKGITWSLFGFENFGVRFKDYGYVFDVSGSSMFLDEKNLYYVISYLCSNTCFKFLSCLAPTVNFQVGNIASLPFKAVEDEEIRQKIDKLAKENIDICKKEWSFYETSIEFKTSPFITKEFKRENLEKTLEEFEKYYNNLREKLRSNEEELNKIFNKIFNVENEIDYKVNDRDLTIRQFDKQDFIKQFLSYSVGVQYGRYDYCSQKPIYNNFEYNISLDNLKNGLEKLLIDIFGEENLDENLEFINKTLKVKSVENYYKKDFLEDHRKQYQGHPIYFLK